MKNPVYQDETHFINVKLNELKDLFSKKKYLEVIRSVKQIDKFLNTEYLDYTSFDDKVACLIFAGISYIELGLYNKATGIFYDIENRYEKLKLFRHFWKSHSVNPSSKEMFDLSNMALKLLKEQIQNFKAHNESRYLSNLAYACYKLEKYKAAIKYYKKALIRDKKNIQLNLGIAQSQYRLYKHNLPCCIKKRFYKTIDLLQESETNFDSLLAIGKMYYFLKDYETALAFVQKALEFAEREPENRIYAYDWLSRIAYITKNHTVAISFYEEVIKCLVEFPDNQQDVIHPKPKLYDMMKYLNDNKRIVHNQEMRTLWYTVIVLSLIHI